MNSKILIVFIVILVISNLIFLFLAVQYRRVVAERNKSYIQTPSLPKYKNANNEFKILLKDIHYYDNSTIFIGSSIIENWNFENLFKDKAFINRGIGDDDSSDMLKRFEEDVVGLKPKNVVIYFGANDIKKRLSSDQSKDNLKQMLKLSYENKINSLVLLFLPVNYKSNAALRYTHSKDKMRALNKQLVKSCEQDNTAYINLFSTIRKRDDFAELYFNDGIHLNAKGYQVLSGIVQQKLDAEERK
ncbi:MAG: hypothetical protein B6I30_03595 [Desulfobacteraceae bacterium 4572_187]|nr:MAG: hypothetical protein B6I30_03595 [Desulfobacteraceae bacterium 4572_187]